MTIFEYKHQEFVYDILTKKVYMNDVKIWQDTDNQISNLNYYDTFEDWVIDNYYNHINNWLRIAGYSKFKDYPTDLQEFIKTSDIYLIEDDSLITEDGKYININDVREQIDYMRGSETFNKQGE